MVSGCGRLVEEPPNTAGEPDAELPEPVSPARRGGDHDLFDVAWWDTVQRCGFEDFDPARKALTELKIQLDILQKAMGVEAKLGVDGVVAGKLHCGGEAVCLSHLEPPREGNPSRPRVDSLMPDLVDRAAVDFSPVEWAPV